MISNLVSSLKKVAVAASLLTGLMMTAPMLATNAEAAPIGNASFGIGGAFTLPSGANLGTTNSIFISNGGMIIVSAPDTMDLAGLVTFGMSGTLRDLPNISGFTPITGYITLSGGVSVDLSTLTLVGQGGPAPGFINLSGNAIIHAPGFDATTGVLTFTGTSSDNRTFTLAVTTSAVTAPPVEGVPEPMSLGLLGLGILALFAMGRYRRPLSMTSAI